MVWVTACVVMALGIGGCGATGVALEPPVPTATSCVAIDRMAWQLPEQLATSPAVAHVRPVSYRYGLYQSPPVPNTDPDPVRNPYAGMPIDAFTPPPDPMTFVTAEVVEVWKGDLAAGQTIIIWQYGGLLDGVLTTECDAPQLADHIGQDVVIVLPHRHSWAPDEFTMDSSGAGMWWLEPGDDGGMLRSAVADTHPWNGDKDDLTVNQLKQLIADLG
jgi:hypothetical protein